MWITFALLVLLAPAAAQQVSGEVADAVTGEGLARVQVRLLGSGRATVTGENGRFSFAAVAAGSYTLQASTVGYRPARKEFSIGGSETREFEIRLLPETLQHTETLDVTAGPFPEETPAAISVSGGELRNLGSVLADDPLRAVQGLPGVTSSDDFRSQFALRGAPFERIGLYLNGILLHAPFHAVRGDANGASLTMLNGDMLDSVNLYAGAPPVRFADRTAGALDIATRAGNRDRLAIRGAVSASNASVIAEGPVGKSGKVSWLATARKSYLQYIIERTSDDPSLAFGFADGHGRLTWDPAPAHRLDLSVFQGRSGLNRVKAAATVGPNSTITSDYVFTLADASWRYTPHSSFLLTNRLAYLRERYTDRNNQGFPLASEFYGEWVWNADSTWVWGSSAPLDFGWSLRRLRDDGFVDLRRLNPVRADRIDEFGGAGIRQGAYVQQSWNAAQGRFQLSAGLRWDRHSVSGLQTVSPYASTAFQLSGATRLALAWGQYVQYPEPRQFFSPAGRTTLLPERATHLEVTLEQRLDNRTRLRLELYNRQDRDLLFRPFLEPRLINGAVFSPLANAPIENALRGYARGAQVFLQRRTANGLTGWISYAWGKAWLRDGFARISFPADYDQRHSVTAFLSQRLRPTVNLSAKWVYGSGLPVWGFFRREGDTFFLAEDRNRLRLPYYQRVDFRINKSWIRDRRQVTLFAEVINVLNRDNIRFDELRSYNSRTLVARPNLMKMFPILPSAGIVLEF